jgi:hypothetical protein
MSVQLLVISPPPKDSVAFERAYREEHLPYAGPRLMAGGATGVTTKRVLVHRVARRPSIGFLSSNSLRRRRPKHVPSPKVGRRRSSTQPPSPPADSRNIS